MNIIITENKHIEPGLYSLEELANIMQVIVEAIKNGARVE